MDLRQMRYFIMVAEELNFSRAAERLNMAQPPLSQEIRKLEEEIGVLLFHRTKRKVELSEAGKVFLKEARKTLLQFQQAVKAAQLAGDGKLGNLTVGFVDSSNLVVALIKEFREQFPRIHLTLKEMTTEQQVLALAEKQIQIGFVRSAENQDFLQSEVISEESLLLVLPENHPLCEKESIPMKMLAGEPFILFPRHLGNHFYDLIISYFREYGISLNVVQEAIQMHTILNLVKTGIGLSIVPSTLADTPVSGVVFKEIQEPAPPIHLHAAWRRDEDSPVVLRFLEMLRRKNDIKESSR
ncbi:LysR family transcriptional regulator [Metabacillus sp. GX 13764]|uniref:LysR family transcriptional regulator n=1 Tax=Metabacillus kandeliae TaxID=2900151 RepID=UPI001E502610|nr:LysR family transcriptional regulator [Metabacillus kandeliae]MCD7034146.1 LysR family transcriptional regulator [Metabacillus kandeliae]